MHSKRWQAEEAQVGHFTVLRALPTAQVRSVGPFVFLDHFGPFPAAPETLPAHPHAGIEVMTYLLQGANEHRDSMGNRGIVEAGGAQWMRAGRGILHAETNLPERGPTIHGVQIWARLPKAQQYAEPAYRAIAAEDIPHWHVPSAVPGTTRDASQDTAQDTAEDTEHNAVELRLLAGTQQGHTGPMPLTAPSLLLHVHLPPQAALTLPLAKDFEHGLYGISGTVALGQAAAAFTRGAFALLSGPVLEVRNDSDQPADVLLLGGAPAEQPLYFGGPFVLDSAEALKQAQRDFFAGKMGTLDGVPG